MATFGFKRVVLTQSESDMTEQFYIAVKGSLHSSDSSVFGLTPEEISALSKRYPDSNKEVINGVLIKASPLRVINSLCELGYRVVCSSGEAEIVWTLRREVLDENNPTNSATDFTAQDNDIHKKITIVLEEGRYSIGKNAKVSEVLKQANLVPEEAEDEENKKVVSEQQVPEKKKVERIGTKPEDFAQYSTYKGPKVVIKSPSSAENMEEGAVIINSNVESPENPFANSSYHAKKRPACDPVAADPRRGSMSSSQLSRTPNSVTPKTHDCLHSTSNPTVHQTLDEMDFERGIWMAAMSGDITKVKSHLSKGTRPDIEDQGGYTALHYAARSGHPQICLALIQAGATVDKPTRAGGATALHRAALAGHHEICCLLLRYGANLQARDVDGRTPLHRAVEGGHKEIIEEFLKINPAAAFDKDNQGKSPLTYAEEKGALSYLFMDLVTHK